MNWGRVIFFRLFFGGEDGFVASLITYLVCVFLGMVGSMVWDEHMASFLWRNDLGDSARHIPHSVELASEQNC